LSLGTGSINKTYAYQKAKRWGKVHWIPPILDIYSSGASQTVHHQLSILFDEKGAKDQYLRIEPDLNEFHVHHAMDDASDQNIDKLIDVGDKMVEKYKVEIDAMIHKIVLSNARNPHRQLFNSSK